MLYCASARPAARDIAGGRHALIAVTLDDPRLAKFVLF
jgi:hypothetical protein